MGEMTPLTVTLSESVLADIDRLALDLEKDRDWFVGEAIARMIAEQDAINAFIQEGIDSAENEGTLSHEEVEAWLEARRHQRAAAE